MFELFLRITDISICIQAPFEIKICSESSPFLIQSHDQIDFSVVFKPADSLPELPSDGIWHEDMFYTVLDSVPCVYVRNILSESPYALFRYEDRLIRCYYLPGSEIRLNESSSILNLIGLEKLLLDNSSFLLHSSFIRFQGKGILFSAPCGTGKSTQADLWTLYRGSETLNGDRAGVRLCCGRWMAYGMPFAGTSGIYRNENAPITAIVTLTQGPENVIRRLRPMEAIRRLLSECSCRRWDTEFMNQMIDLLMKLVSQVPVYLLECRPDEGAVDLLYQTLQKDGLL